MNPFVEFFTHIFDFPLVMQFLCVSAATVLCLGVRTNEKRKWWVFAIDGICLAAVFLILDILFFVLAYYVRQTVGLGSFLIFLIGIALYAIIRSKHSVPVRLAMSSVVFSVTVLMALLGTISGNAIVLIASNFDIAITKIIAYLFIVGSAILFWFFPLFKFNDDRFEAILNIICNGLSAALVITYDCMVLHNRKVSSMTFVFSPYMTYVIITLLIINIATYLITFYSCKNKQALLEYQAESLNRSTLNELIALSEHSIAVCDDEQSALDIISTSVKKVFLSHNVDAQVKCFDSVSDLWKKMKFEKFRVLFLDINMPEMNGIEFGEKLENLEVRPEIIFVSSNVSRVFDTFAVHPFGFVRKHKFIKDISGVVERFVKQKMNEGGTVLQLEIKRGKDLTAIKLAELKYIECLRDMQIFHMNGSPNQTVHSRMNAIEGSILSHGFIRIHKGYIVNCRYIKRFNTKVVVLNTGEELPVGRSKSEDAMKKYFEYMRKNGITIIG